MEDKASQQEHEQSDVEEQRGPGEMVRVALQRVRRFVTPDRLAAVLCLVTALTMTAPWVQVSVAQLVGRTSTYTVADVLATSQLVVDKAQSLQDVIQNVREVADRAAGIIERVEDVADRVAAERDERGDSRGY